MADGLNEVVVAVVVAVVLGVGAYVVAKLRTIGGDLTALARHVLPHFEPSTDEYGREHYEHTLPARVDKLVEEYAQVRADLVDHMKGEEALRAADIEQRIQDQVHRAKREAMYDELIEQLRAGNPEVRQ